MPSEGHIKKVHELLQSPCIATTEDDEIEQVLITKLWNCIVRKGGDDDE